MSTIRCDNFGPSAGGTTYSARGIAKAWVNFNGTGTIAARDSENVSSLTDNGTGDYTVSFSNAFGAADYCPATSLGFVGATNSLYVFSVKSNGVFKFSNSFRGETTYADSVTDRTLFDFDEVNISCLGDLA